MSSIEQPPPAGKFESLTPFAKSIVAALLTAEFPGRHEVALQLATARARPLDEHGCLELKASENSPRAQVARRVPVEAETPDLDGMTIHILLHVVDGYVDELEFYRDDSGDLLGSIKPDALRVVVFDRDVDRF